MLSMGTEGIQTPLHNAALGFVYLVGEIDDELMAKVVMGLVAAKEAGHTQVHLAISSEGGDLFGGLAIADAIYAARKAGIEVEGEVYGQCCSAATFPLLACTRRSMQREAWLGIHGMTAGVRGDMKDMEAEHAFNKRLAAQQARMYANGSKQPEEYWEPILKEKIVKYYSADEALEEGLIDVIS